MWNFSNPVQLQYHSNSLVNINQWLKGRSYCIVTYQGAPFTGWLDTIQHHAGKALAIIDDVEPNPSLPHLISQAQRLNKLTQWPEVIIGLGGGSALDSAKFIAASNGAPERLAATLRAGEKVSASQAKLIAIPTTAGTGSEVTCWATVWDTDNQKKLSLEAPSLYAEHAIIDAELMVNLPLNITINTALDALSHAFESLWNKHRNPVSSTLAISAIQGVFQHLPALCQNLSDLNLRKKVATSATLAGLAFSNTKTALAHNISYAVTMKYGVVHGLACSFTLPSILGAMIGQDAELDSVLAQAFPVPLNQAPEYMKSFFQQLHVATDYQAYGIEQQDWQHIVDDAFDGARGANFIGQKQQVMGLLA